MADLKIKLERLLTDAADCQLISELAADRARRDEFRQRAAQFTLLAEQVKAQIGARPRDGDIAFLREQARVCRQLATGLADEAMTASLIALATELEDKAAENERPSRH
jgi:hypothetical protein